jgi:hypothetical protein
VVAVTRTGQAVLKQVTKDFGISKSRPTNWLKAADTEEQESEVLRRTGQPIPHATSTTSGVLPVETGASDMARLGALRT